MCKEYYIIIDGLNVPVTKEVYYAYLRPVWKEHKREKIHHSCEISLDELIESGIDISDDAPLVCDVVEDKLMLDMLIKSLDELDDDKQSLIKALYFDAKTEFEFACKIGISQPAIHKRLNLILKKLKKLLF